MEKKIVAIGGGMIGEMDQNGRKFPYETYLFDKEIITLSGKTKPNVLFIGLADVDYSYMYFEYFRNVYENIFKCNCKHLTLQIVSNPYLVDELFKWADVFYVGGGNAYTLMNYLTRYNIDSKLYDSYIQGKVMSGISAGAMCWFQYGNSIIPDDYIKSGKRQLIKQKCLGFENMIFSPHCDEVNGHFENIQNLLLNESMVGISLSNCACLEIVDGKYRLLGADANRYGISPFGIKSYWNEKKYYIENLDVNAEFKSLGNLLNVQDPKNQLKNDVKRLLKKRNLL